MVKKWVKFFLRTIHLLPLTDKIHLYLNRAQSFPANRKFKKEHPDFAIPPDALLHETYRLDYAQYKADGWQTAREISQWMSTYAAEPKQVMEWGCGPARIIRHIPHFIPAATQINGCDISRDMIKWNIGHIQHIQFDHIQPQPPLPYAAAQFDWIYAVSVLTHIDAPEQHNWINEIARVLRPGGIFLFTTHGRFFFSQLLPWERKQLNLIGIFTIAFPQKGHRMMTTFHQAAEFRKMIAPQFEVLSFYDGQDDPARIGGQDLWIVRKK